MNKNFVNKLVFPNLWAFSGSDLLTCILPTFCSLTLWAISLESYGKPSILEADDFLGACCRKAMTPESYGLSSSPQFYFLLLREVVVLISRGPGGGGQRGLES